MDLKDFITSLTLPHPKQKDIREYFHLNDQNNFIGPEFHEAPAPQKTKRFVDIFLKQYEAVTTKYPDEMKEILPNSNFMGLTGGLFMTFNAFYPTIKLLGSPEQIAKWEELVFAGRLIGAYAQTEIAHGSDVQALQTTAIYDKERKIFVFNTPNTKGVKFWPGALGWQSTHVVCQCQTFINGKNYGLQTFAVQIRDTKTYKLLKGVDAGDIGPKLAYSWNDNGYLRFVNYEAPLDSLLMKFIKVEEDGTVAATGDKNSVKIGYGGMLGLRVNLSKYFVLEGLRSLMLGYRNWQKEGTNDVATRRLFLNEFAYCYANALTLEWVISMYNRFSENVHKNLKLALNELIELHIVASGLKAFYSWRVVEQTRTFCGKQVMGVVGALVSQYADIVPSVTYEGDNVVMLQQTAKGLCKFMQHAENDEFKKVPESVKFLVELRGLLEKEGEVKLGISDPRELVNLDRLEEMINAISLFAINECYQKMKEAVMSGESMNGAWNEKLQTPMVEMALGVTRGLTFRMSKQFFLSKETQEKLRAQDCDILKGILYLYGLEILQKDLSLACRFKIGGTPENLGKILSEAQEIVFRDMEKHLSYLGNSTLFYEEEIYMVKDFKKWSSVVKDDDRIKTHFVSLDEIPSKSINKFSKL